MTELKCAVWNCSGILPGGSTSAKLDFLRYTFDGSLDILVFIETHHKQMSDIEETLHTFSTNYHILHTEAPQGDPYSGIVVLVRKKFSILNCNMLIPGRLINLKINSSKENYNLSAMYGHTGHALCKSKMIAFVDQLTKVHQMSDTNIILGDFNFVDNVLDRANWSKIGLNNSDKLVYQIWEKLTIDLQLSDAFRAKNPKRRMFSYVHTSHNAKSRLDRVYVSDKSVNDIVKYHILTQFVKSHRIVTFSIRENVERGPGFWKMNTSIIPDQAYERVIELAIQDVLNLNLTDHIERWLIFIETIRIETQIYCTRKRQQEIRIKELCEEKIRSLEQNPLLASTPQLCKDYEYYSEKLHDWTRKQIEGHKTRIKSRPQFEAGEPNIAFYAALEKSTGNKKTITELKNDNGDFVHETDEIIETATDFYTELFDTKSTDSTATDSLLRNIKKKITTAQRVSLDKALSLEELEKAISKLQKGRSPGPDGVPAEFYQHFWSKIKYLYLDFLNQVKISCFPTSKNTSITTLIYKEKGESYLLANYRPIALMNVDVKILTKLLSMRLLLVLPSIIHESQTAVYGRRIDNNIHLVRDLIDLANQNDEEAALLFLDQEKAFDRVNHKVLYSTMTRFGFGPEFVSWIRMIYSNASTRIDINGFHTKSIPLKSGVRQGCPLSPLLYVLIIELLALQLRSNPNIVGFTIDTDNIVSSHYSDDAVIKITQNRFSRKYIKILRYIQKEPERK